MKDQDDIFKSLAALPNVWQSEAHVEWTIEGMLPAGSVNLISSESGTGKTWLAYALAGSVSRGLPFIGLPVRQMPTLYTDGENPVGVIKDRLKILNIPETPNLYLWGGWHHDDPPFGPDDARAEQFAAKTKGFMIWDSLIEFHPGEESSASDTRKYMKFFRKLANLGATVLILHHSGKGSSSKQYRGSSDIKAAVDTAYTLEKASGALGVTSDRLCRLRITNFKSRFAEGRNFSLEFMPDEGFQNLEETIKGDAKARLATLESLLREEPINGKDFKARAKEKDIPREVAERFLKGWPHKGPGSKPNQKVYWRPAKVA